MKNSVLPFLKMIQAMSDKIIYTIGIISILTMIFFAGVAFDQEHLTKPIKQLDTVYVETEWSRLVHALISVESEWNPEAVNEQTGATGILQLMPIYIEDVNRIVKEDRYTLEDRLDPLKSIEMFSIYQRHYNPSMDIDKAIKLHNPRAGEWYYKRVKNKMI